MNFCDMESKEIELQIMAISELTKEIGCIVEETLEKGNPDLTPSDIEHILKMTADVTNNMQITKKIPAV